jgi:putative tributyrin esterase
MDGDCKLSGKFAHEKKEHVIEIYAERFFIYQEQHMATMQINFFSKSLKKIVTIMALIPVDSFMRPEDKACVPEEGFKSLYLLHGFSGTFSDWATNTNIQELSLEYKIAVFMPSCGNNFYLDDNARSELYQQFVGNELVEITRLFFPLSNRRKDTFIGGLSMGGFGAIHTAFAYPETFSRIIAFSSALIIHDIAGISSDFKDIMADYNYYHAVFGDLNHLIESSNNPETLLDMLLHDEKEVPEIFMACGTDDFLIKENRAFHDFLDSRNITHDYFESAGIHNWKFWNKYIGKAVAWLIK